MDRMSGGEPGLHFEVPSAPETVDSDSEHAVERGQPDHHETAPSKAPAVPTQVSQPTPIVPTTPATSSDQPDSQQQTTPATPLITAGLAAADTNKIEKEWVDAAKLIISKTRNDPYRQKQEVSRIKADYQMKRFNKHPSTDDAVTV